MSLKHGQAEYGSNHLLLLLYQLGTYQSYLHTYVAKTWYWNGCQANLLDTFAWPKPNPDELSQDQREWCAHFNKTAQSWGNDESARMQISSHKASYGIV